MNYTVIWAIEIEADNEREAAQTAREYQLDPDSHATVFNIEDEHGAKVSIDLLDVEVPESSS